VHGRFACHVTLVFSDNFLRVFASVPPDLVFVFPTSLSPLAPLHALVCLFSLQIAFILPEGLLVSQRLVPCRLPLSYSHCVSTSLTFVFSRVSTPRIQGGLFCLPRHVSQLNPFFFFDRAAVLVPPELLEFLAVDFSIFSRLQRPCKLSLLRPFFVFSRSNLFPSAAS